VIYPWRRRDSNPRLPACKASGNERRADLGKCRSIRNGCRPVSGCQVTPLKHEPGHARTWPHGLDPPLARELRLGRADRVQRVVPRSVPLLQRRLQPRSGTVAARPDTNNVSLSRRANERRRRSRSRSPPVRTIHPVPDAHLCLAG